MDIFIVYMDIDCPTNIILVGPFKNMRDAGEHEAPIGYISNIVKSFDPQNGY